MINLVFELLYFLCLFLILNKQRTDHLFDIFLLKMKLVDHFHVHVLEPLFYQRSQFLHLKTLYSSGYYIYWFLLLTYRTFNLRYLFIRHWFWYGILACLWREVWSRNSLNLRLRIKIVPTWSCRDRVDSTHIWLIFICIFYRLLSCWRQLHDTTVFLCSNILRWFHFPSFYLLYFVDICISPSDWFNIIVHFNLSIFIKIWLRTLSSRIERIYWWRFRCSTGWHRWRCRFVLFYENCVLNCWVVSNQFFSWLAWLSQIINK